MLNRTTLIGRLPQDPDLQYTNEGTAMVKFSVVDDRTHDEKTQYIDIIDWGDAAENHNQYLEKGSLVAVTGPLDLNKWVDDTDTTRFSPQILAGRYGGRVVYLGGGSSSGKDNGDDEKETTSDDEEDIPF